MGIADIIDILVVKYTLCEIEEYLSIEPADLTEGLEAFVEEFYDEILNMLEEDGWLT